MVQQNLLLNYRNFVFVWPWLYGFFFYEISAEGAKANIFHAHINIRSAPAWVIGRQKCILMWFSDLFQIDKKNIRHDSVKFVYSFEKIRQGRLFQIFYFYYLGHPTARTDQTANMHYTLHRQNCSGEPIRKFSIIAFLNPNSVTAFRKILNYFIWRTYVPL